MILKALEKGVSEEHLARAQRQHFKHSQQTTLAGRNLRRGSKAVARPDGASQHISRVEKAAPHAADRSRRNHDRDEQVFMALCQVACCRHAAASVDQRITQDRAGSQR